MIGDARGLEERLRWRVVPAPFVATQSLFLVLQSTIDVVLGTHSPLQHTHHRLSALDGVQSSKHGSRSSSSTSHVLPPPAEATGQHAGACSSATPRPLPPGPAGGFDQCLCGDTRRRRLHTTCLEEGRRRSFYHQH